MYICCFDPRSEISVQFLPLYRTVNATLSITLSKIGSRLSLLIVSVTYICDMTFSRTADKLMSKYKPALFHSRFLKIQTVLKDSSCSLMKTCCCKLNYVRSLVPTKHSSFRMQGENISPIDQAKERLSVSNLKTKTNTLELISSPVKLIAILLMYSTVKYLHQILTRPIPYDWCYNTYNIRVVNIR